MKKIMINSLAVAALSALALTGCSAGAAPTDAMSAKPSDAMSAEPSDAMSTDNQAMAKDNKMAKDDKMTGNEAMAAPTYVDYDSYTAEKAKFSNQRVVLFFAASWCPACREIDSALSKDSSALPEGVTFVKVDYDAHTDLRKEYGVTMQHTFVEVDGQGKEVKKWVSTDVESAIAEAKK